MIFIKLLLAHLIGDFLFQPKAWVKQKEQKKLRAFPLYLHGFIHAALSALFIFKADFWLAALVLFLVHICIDGLKLIAQTPATKRRWFFIDQLLHLLSLLFIWLWYADAEPDFSILNSTALWLTITIGFALTLPASFLIKNIIERWAPVANEVSDDSLQNAGRYIGITERILVYTLILSGHIGAVGFLLAAKSVFRFGDLRQAQDRRLTEYILIGTLLSIGLALFSGLLVNYLI